MCKFSLLLIFISICCSHIAEASTPFQQQFPLSCIPDFSQDTLPKGHGFLSVGSDGHFYWANGERAKFWGINVSSTRLEIPLHQIDDTVALFARSGMNMVRFEAIDNRNCILGSVNSPNSLHLAPVYLHYLDEWIAALHQYHIAYYLDLLDLRTFKQGDGVPNADSLRRGARPYAFFDPKLIELQKVYAKELLLHYNPYTHEKLVNDPNLALVEICNENGFFLYSDRLSQLIEPYNSELNSLWCKWLIQKYHNRASLKKAWGDMGSVSVLGDNEHLSNSSVQLPDFSVTSASMPSNVTDVLRSPQRLSDGVRFLVHVQKQYFTEMHKYLRSIGLRVPITGVVSSTVVPDLASVADTCDFTAENWYGQSLDVDPQTGDRCYDDHNILNDDGLGGFAPYTAGLKWRHKPVVIREWDTTWPDPYRAASVPEVLAYASLQDYDAVLLFGYQTNTALNGAKPDSLNDFAVECDPTVWGMYALAGWAFLHNYIQPAVHSITQIYSSSNLYKWPNTSSALLQAAWSVRVNSGFSSGKSSLPVVPADADAQSQLANLFYTLENRGAPISPDDITNGIWHSDTGQITLYTHRDLLVVQSPALAMVAGKFDPKHTYRIGDLCFSTPTPYGAFMAIALDGKPLSKSRNLVIKMVSIAANTGQKLIPAPAGAPAKWELSNPGAAPVITMGTASSQPTKVWFLPKAHNQKPELLLSLHMKNGVWELDLHSQKIELACDTPAMSARLLGNRLSTLADAKAVSYSCTGELNGVVHQTVMERLLH